MEFKTKSMSIACQKRLLYYVPRARVNCQSHAQCYSLYTSSDCHGDKCGDFQVNDTIKALESTREHLGWSSCAAYRIPSCTWWLTRDCIFSRSAFVNPTEETYEVFNCSEWNYAVNLEIIIHANGNGTTASITVHSGPKIPIFGITVELISASIPPAPILNQCFIRRLNQIAISPCNDREELGEGRLGEIQCNTEAEAATLKTSCKAKQSLINTQIDSTGIKCSSELIDPQLLLTNQPYH